MMACVPMQSATPRIEETEIALTQESVNTDIFYGTVENVNRSIDGDLNFPDFNDLSSFLSRSFSSEINTGNIDFNIDDEQFAANIEQEQELLFDL